MEIIYSTKTLIFQINKMNFEIVFACDNSSGIGINRDDNKNTIPWKITEDMKFFRELTKSVPGHVLGTVPIQESDPNSDQKTIQTQIKYINAVIMGRKTADTFQKPLPDRLNVVITSNQQYRTGEGFIVFNTLDSALKGLKDNTGVPSGHQLHKVFVIGGAVLGETAVKHRRCRGVYLNKISHDYECDIKLSKDFIDVLEGPKNNFVKTQSLEIVFCKNLNKNVQIAYTKYTYLNREEDQYLQMLEKILDHGDYRETRNAKTYSIFGERLEFDMANGFPLLTTKQVFFRGIAEEDLLFLRGQTDTKFLEDKKVMIWHDNTTKEFLLNNKKNLEEFDMGPMYGYQWRHFGALYKGCHANYDGQGVDQLQNAIDLLVRDPHSRRILMTTYNPAQAEEGVLYPCHGLTVQFYVEKNNRISLQMYQRSADSILGAPFNIASYALLLHIVVELVNNHELRKHTSDYTPGRVIMIFGDTHIYSDEKGDHVVTAKEQLARRYETYPFCDFKLKKRLYTLKDLDTLQTTDMEITNYISGSALKAKMIA